MTAPLKLHHDNLGVQINTYCECGFMENFSSQNQGEGESDLTLLTTIAAESAAKHVSKLGADHEVRIQISRNHSLVVGERGCEHCGDIIPEQDSMRTQLAGLLGETLPAELAAPEKAPAIER